MDHCCRWGGYNYVGLQRRLTWNNLAKLYHCEHRPQQLATFYRFVTALHVPKVGNNPSIYGLNKWPSSSSSSSSTGNRPHLEWSLNECEHWPEMSGGALWGQTQRTIAAPHSAPTRHTHARCQQLRHTFPVNYNSDICFHHFLFALHPAPVHVAFGVEEKKLFIHLLALCLLLRIKSPCETFSQPI